MQRWFTADFHLGMEGLMALERWPFKTIEEHDQALLEQCMATSPDDIVYHLGDFASYGVDNHFKSSSRGLETKPMKIAKSIPASFINIRGNHDSSNKVFSTCDAMVIKLSKKYPQVSMSHYPTLDCRVDHSCLAAPIHLCGHVHTAWRHCLDLDCKILNINVGCMAWGFKMLDVDTLAHYLDKLFKMSPDQLFRAKRDHLGKVVYFKPQK